MASVVTCPRVSLQSLQLSTPFLSKSVGVSGLRQRETRNLRMSSMATLNSKPIFHPFGISCLVRQKWRLSAKGKGFGNTSEETQTESIQSAETSEAANPEIVFGQKSRRKLKVVAPAVDNMKKDSSEMTEEEQYETLFVGLLLFVFLVIMGMGFFIAASGFLPDNLDQFAQDTVYPSFTPVLGLFLALSSAYGLYKATKGQM
mmetsp:Transcript_39899/g.55463  ORF Transcript_39899/g.55463 Transcript_39899/m.55463 type:complete len:202 (-) Transcript_39899:190-795(-)|eukprot:CAMPEP_0196580736 /NCGR_PEP_ID=MMETSP1081-20130531/30308_1 /TAXON_ID=36882 /ORGANISM="Pyramimonas amylifera, Strain CCMP720" /LENGTH=201 /DNA_ID=CAMNT_0041900693 /DNA_START=94 /DNA_END=699 /DNA_ORIENTATION=+